MSIKVARASLILAAIASISCVEAPVEPNGPAARSDLFGVSHRLGSSVLSLPFGYVSEERAVAFPADDFSEELRIRPMNSDFTALTRDISWLTGAEWDFGYSGAATPDRTGNLYFYASPDYEFVTAPVQLTVGEWHDITFGRKSGQLFLVVDGTSYELSGNPAVPTFGSDDLLEGNGHFELASFGDVMIERAVFRDLAKKSIIEEFGFDEGDGRTTTGTNGTVLDLQGVWLPTGRQLERGLGHGDHAIDACGTEITTPGKYYVTADLLNCPSDGIRILTSGVTVNVQNHVIDGVGNGNGIGVALGVAGGVHDIAIMGPGNLRQFVAGVAFEGVSASRVEGLIFDDNAFGMAVNAAFTTGQLNLLSTDNVLTGNSFFFGGHPYTVNGGARNQFIGNRMAQNFGIGVFLFMAKDNIVRDNLMLDNFGGIDVRPNDGGFSTGNVITHNLVRGTYGFADLSDEWGDCTHNTWTLNTFGTSNPSCIR